MLTRLISFVLVIAIIAMPLGGVGAVLQETTPERDATSMARFFVEDTLFYASIPLPDASLIDQLEMFVQEQSEALGIPLGSPFGPPVTLRDTLNEALLPTGLTVDELFAMFGDQAAVGVGSFDPLTAQARDTYVLIEIRNRETAETLLQNTIGLDSNYERRQAGNMTVFVPAFGSDAYGVSDDHLMLFNINDGVPQINVLNSLADSPRFNAAFNALPERQYSTALYFDMPGIFEIDGAAQALEPLGVLPEFTGPLAIGVAEAQDGVSIIDSAQLPGPRGGAQPVTPIDPDFARFMPGDTSFMIHATNLTGLYDSFIGFARSVDDGFGPDPAVEAEQAFDDIGIDLQNDILDWTTGDYGVFLSLDIEPIIRAALEERVDLNNRFNFGMVVEATDPAAAQDFAAFLGDMAMTELTGEPDVRVVNRAVGGVDSTVISASASLSPTETFKLETAIGASDDIFFVSTVSAAEHILSGENTLLDNPDYQLARQYFLPNPSVVVYGDGAGVLFGTTVPIVVILALLGPAIGNVFEDIITELEAPQSNAVPSTAFARQQPVDPLTEQVIEQFIDTLNNSGTIAFTRTVTPNGTTLLRLSSTAAEGEEAVILPLLFGSVGTVVVLALLGPAIGNVFDEIAQDF
ncbi:MAG: DUF3352 domain-containing protein [Chloroflexi bacterium]|nr:MAG: DUF3352 domain-containing protein [Chloroflexota bacterium]